MRRIAIADGRLPAMLFVLSLSLTGLLTNGCGGRASISRPPNYAEKTTTVADSSAGTAGTGSRPTTSAVAGTSNQDQAVTSSNPESSGARTREELVRE